MKREKKLFKYDELIDQVLEQSIAFTKSRVLLTAYDLEIFTVLGDTSKTADEVAQIVNADRNGISRLMNALVSLSLLEKQGERFVNTKPAFSLLVKGNPNYMANLKYMNYIWKQWNDLTEAVKTGKAVNAKSVSEFDSDELADYIAAEHWRASLQAPEIIKHCKLENVERVIDLGCGSGAIGMEILKNHPDTHLTLFDYPNVTELTKEYVEKKGYADKVKIISGDMFTDDYDGSYDVVIISNVLRSYPLIKNLKVMRKVFDSLVRDGRVLIHEFMLNESRDNPEFSTLLSLHMLVASEGGDALSETDAWLLLKESMFSNIEKTETAFGSYLMVGQK
jgi:ubiquinone/menaquinone biosynthesis C-methylase UbiE